MAILGGVRLMQWNYCNIRANSLIFRQYHSRLMYYVFKNRYCDRTIVFGSEVSTQSEETLFLLTKEVLAFW